jgi:hypothetical protein
MIMILCVPRGSYFNNNGPSSANGPAASVWGFLPKRALGWFFGRACAVIRYHTILKYTSIGSRTREDLRVPKLKIAET